MTRLNSGLNDDLSIYYRGNVTSCKLSPNLRKQPKVRASLQAANVIHGVQRRMISVDNFFVFLRLLFFALLLLYET